MRKSASFVVLAWILSACSLIPDYSRPESTPPTAWTESKAGAGVWPDADWWKQFQSPELDRLMADATAANLDLAAAVSRVQQAEAEAKIAGAAQYPTLGANGSADRSKAPVLRSSNSAFGSRSSGPTTIYSATLTAAYEVDLWGKNRSAADAAITRVQSSQFDQQTVALTLQSDVATTYFQILSLRDRVRLAEDTLKSAEDILSLLEKQRTAGTISDLEVAQQKNAVATQRAAIPVLQQAERQAIHALAVLLGRNPEDLDIDTKSLNDAKVPPVVAGIPSQLLERRPDIRKAEADLVAAHFDIENARAQRFPSIGLTAEGGTESLAFSGLMGSGSFLYDLAAPITAPIFEGGKLEGQEELTKGRYQELLEDYRKAILSGFQDVEDSLAAVRGSSEQHRYEQEAYDQAEEAYRLADLRFRAGTVDFLTVLQSQLTVFQAADALVQADVARFNAVVGLYKALGGGWPGTVAAPPPPAPIPGEPPS